MATRFGAASPAQTYQAKVRWLVGCLFAVIVVLVVALIAITKTGPDEQASVSDDGDSAYAAVSDSTPKVGILVANQRIEVGSSLGPHMFSEEEVSQERVPAGAILARDKVNIAGKYASSLINANLPLLQDDIQDSPPIQAVTSNIPPGYRAVTITVDARSGVEGWAQPNTRVDVLWSYKDKDGSRKVATIVHFSKILSVAGRTAADVQGGGSKSGGQTTTVTLLTTERDAKKIELARQAGQLSLSLVGEREGGKPMSDPDPIDLTDLLPRAGNEPAPQEPDPDGVMYTKDSVTGKLVRCELRGRRWKCGE